MVSSLLDSGSVPPGVVTNVQLRRYNVAAVLFKWNNGMAVNVQELCIATGYAYSKVRKWKLTLFEDKITRSEFNRWKRAQPVTETLPAAPREDRQSGPATRARQRRSTSGKSGGSPCSRGSRAASQSSPEAHSGDTK